MNISRHKRIFLISAYLGPAVLGLSGLATQAAAQTPVKGPNADAASTLHADSAAGDELIRIAGKAAGNARVIDNLSITQGGR